MESAQSWVPVHWDLFIQSKCAFLLRLRESLISSTPEPEERPKTQVQTSTNPDQKELQFSSGDLSSELDDAASDGSTSLPPTHEGQVYSTATQEVGGSPRVPGGPPQSQSGGDLSLNLRSSSRTTSAPSSPAKTRESLLQRVQSLTGAARDQGASILGAAVSTAGTVSTGRPTFNKDKCSTLLVIDDQNTDW
ncbi:Synapsin, partial [Gryllus bimaculatus]